jgi:predicted anti-sigma-YlaC factor YlaD
MNDLPDIDDLLAVDSVDAGCDATFEVLHEYVETELAGGDPGTQQPAVAAHLRACPACREDYLGLREAVRHFGDS